MIARSLINASINKVGTILSIFALIANIKRCSRSFRKSSFLSAPNLLTPSTMKAILTLAAVLAFAGFNQAATTVQVPLTFTNNADKSLTMAIGPQSVTLPGSIMAFAPMALNMLGGFIRNGDSGAHFSLPIQVTVNDDGSVSAGAMGIMMLVPADIVNQLREVLAYVQKMITPPEQYSG